MRSGRVVTAALVCSLAVPVAAQTTDADLERQRTVVRKQLVETEKAVAMMRVQHDYPDCSDRAAWEPPFLAAIDKAARKLKINGPEIKPREGSEPIPLSDGSFIARYDLNGSGQCSCSTDRSVRVQVPIELPHR